MAHALVSINVARAEAVRGSCAGTRRWPLWAVAQNVGSRRAPNPRRLGARSPHAGSRPRPAGDHRRSAHRRSTNHSPDEGLIFPTLAPILILGSSLVMRSRVTDGRSASRCQQMGRSAPRPPFGVPGLRQSSVPPGGLARTRPKHKNPHRFGVHLENPSEKLQEEVCSHMVELRPAVATVYVSAGDVIALPAVAAVSHRRHNWGYANPAACGNNTRPIFGSTYRDGGRVFGRSKGQSRTGQPALGRHR
jgi:hypothetical protein